MELFTSYSSLFIVMFASVGEMIPPCDVPDTGSIVLFSTIKLGVKQDFTTKFSL